MSDLNIEQDLIEPEAQAVDLSNIDFAVEPDDWIDVAALREMYHPFNSQTRDDYELTSIQRSIQKNGFTGMMIVVNRWNGKIVSGHGKVEACFRAGYRDKLPVVWREYKGEIEHRNAMLQFNMASGHQDPEKQRREIEALLAAIPEEELLPDMAITPDELQKILGLAVEVGSEGDSDHRVPREAPPSDGEWGDAFNKLPEQDRAPFRQMTFILHDTQAEQVDRAIAAAKKQRDFVDSPNQNGNGNALSFICETFLTEHGQC